MNTRQLLRTITIAISAAFVVISGSSAASADPVNAQHAFVVPLVCDDGEHRRAVVNGNGQFAAIHDTASTTILVPTTIGSFHGVVEDRQGNLLFEFTEPAVHKGTATPVPHTLVGCTFTLESTGFDPQLQLDVHFVGHGSVTGFVTPTGSSSRR